VKQWFVYIVRCRDLSLYTGITNDLPARVAKHNKGKGAKYTRARGPVTLVWSKEQPDWLTAAREERRIKKLSKKQKEALVASR
jgi:putative endonuclease